MLHLKLEHRTVRWLVYAGIVAFGLVIVGLTAQIFAKRGAADRNEAAKQNAAPVRLVAHEKHSLQVADDTVRRMGVALETVKEAPTTAPLRLTGSLFIDPSRLVHVRARFPGEVVMIGLTAETGGTVGAERRLRVGDKVEKDQLLAQLWCKEVGEKKSDLVDSLSQLYLDQAVHKRLRSLEVGVIAQRSVEEAERRLEADRIAVNRAERTLRSWRLTDKELDAIRAEAQRIHSDKDHELPTRNSDWAEATIRSPIGGTILEKNVVAGDIVDNSLDLFKVADLSRLGVMAHVYEEDLPKLESLHADERKWRIQLKSDPSAPELVGTFDLVGNLVDPNQHTAAIVGWLDNPGGHLRVGQFISVTIELPAPHGQLIVPDSALLVDGSRNYVFVARNGAKGPFQRRQVGLVRFADRLAYLHSEPTEDERAVGAEPIAAGEQVVSSGVVELAGALNALRVQAPPSSQKEERLE